MSRKNNQQRGEEAAARARRRRRPTVTITVLQPRRKGGFRTRMRTVPGSTTAKDIDGLILFPEE